jgi:hypothetical protein
MTKTYEHLCCRVVPVAQDCGGLIWRVLYDVESGRLVVRVLKIGPRGGIYE